MSLEPNSEVIVVALNKRGKILEVIKPGVYRVLVGAMSMRCKEGELRFVSKGKAKQDKKKRSYSSEAPLRDQPLTVDLHGMREAEARDAVEHAVNRAVLDGYQVLEIVHGIGEGTLKSAVNDVLGSLSVVKAFKSWEL